MTRVHEIFLPLVLSLLLLVSSLFPRAHFQDWVGDQNLGEGSVQHAALHGFVGCASSTLSGGNCASGAVGAIAQSLYAGSLGDHSNFTDKQKAQYASNAQLIGASAGLFFSEGKAENVAGAGAIAESGFKNNYLSHQDLDDLKEDLAKCLEENGGSCPREDRINISKKFQARSDAADAALFSKCAGSASCIQAERNQTISRSDLNQTLDALGLGGAIELGSNAFVTGNVWDENYRDARAQSLSDCASGDLECVRQAQRTGMADYVTGGRYSSAINAAGCAQNVSMSACTNSLIELGAVVTLGVAGKIVVKFAGKRFKLSKQGDGFSTEAYDADRGSPAGFDAPNTAGAGRYTPSQPLDAAGNPIVRTNDRGGVLVQPNGSVTCGQHSCGMVLNTRGNPVAVDDIISDFPPTSPQGTSMSRVSSALRANDVNTVTLSNGNLSVDNLASFTANGRPSIAMVRTGPNTNHYVVVDGVTTRGGQRVVAVRDPAGGTNGGVYYETVSSFESRFTGNAIRIVD